jgi:hypothetical protein
MKTSEVEYILDIIPSPFTTITVCLLFKPFILRELEIRSRGSLLPDDSLILFFLSLYFLYVEVAQMEVGGVRKVLILYFQLPVDWLWKNYFQEVAH